MAAGRKEYELQMKLSAAIGSSFNSSFQAAISTTKKLQTTLSSLKKVQGDVSAYKKTQEALSATKAKVQEYEAKHNTLQSELAQTAAKEKELQTALKQSEKSAGKESEEYKKLQKQLQNTRNEKSKLKSQIKENEHATASANEKIKEQEKNLSELSNKLRTTGVSTSNLTKENDKLKEAYQRVKKAQEDCVRINSAIEKNKAAISATKSELLKTIGVVSAAGAAFYKGFITPAANLQEQMSTVQAISGAEGKDFENLNALAKKMGATTKFTAVEAGQALEYMAMAGWKTNQMMSGLPGIMNLAAASGEELATVADIVTDAMTAFKLSADGTTNGISNVNYFTDVLAATAANSNTNVALLGESFKYAAPLAGSFGFSVEDTALMLGLMANSGIKASQSGTSLRKVFTALTGELKIAQKDGSQFIVATQNADGSMRDLKAIIDDVRTAFNGMTDSDIIAMQKDLSATAQSLGIELNDENGNLKTQAALYADVQDAIQNMTDAGKIQEAEAIASKTAMAGLLSIVNASSEDYTKLADAIYNANGAAEKMAQTRLNNLKGDITLAKSAWDGLATTIGEMFLPNLRTAVTKVTEFLNQANKFAQENPKLIKQIAKIAAGLAALKVGSLAGKLGFLNLKGGVLEVVKSFVGLKSNIAQSAASALTGGNSIKTLGTILSGLGGKILPIIGIISALSILFLKLRGEDISSFIEPFKNAFEELKPVLSTAMERFKELGNQVLPLLVEAAKKLAPILGQIVTAVLPVVIQLIDSLVPLICQIVQELLPVALNIITTLAPLISEIITSILPIVVQLLGILLPIINQIVTSVLPIVVDVLNEILPLITELIQAVLPVLIWVLQALMPIIQAVAELFSVCLASAIEKLKPIIEAFMVYLKGIIDFISGVFTGDWGKAWEGIKNIFRGIWNGLVSIVKIPIEMLKTLFWDSLIVPIGNFFVDLWEKIKAPFVAIYEWFNSNVIQPVVNVFAPIVSKIGEIFSKIWEIITVLFGVLANWFNDNVITPIVDFFKTTVETIGGIFNNVWNAITGIFSSVGEWFSTKFSEAWEAIKNIFAPVGDFFKGVWNNIVSIFSEIGTVVGDAISGAFKNVVNTIIGFAEGIINGFIGAINKAIGLINKIPGVNIELIETLNIPKLEKGSNYTPDTFIAGDVNGKGGELVTGARGRKVFTAAQTNAIFDNINRAKAINDSAQQSSPQTITIIERIGGFIGAVKSAAAERITSEAASVNTSEIPTSNEQISFVIHYNPTIYIEGDKPDDLEEKLKENNQKLLELFKDYLRQQRENERRMSYA